MKVWVIEIGVQYEGSSVTAILDHTPSQEDIDHAVCPVSGRDKNLDFVHVHEWDVNGSSANFFWIDAPDNKYEEKSWDGRFLLYNKREAGPDPEAEPEDKPKG